MRKYKFEYGYSEGEAVFEVDTTKFTEEFAQATLGFFMWDFDGDADPIDEVMIKYAIEAIQTATFGNLNTYGVKESFNEKEGFCKVDGSSGITLIHVEGYVFDENNLKRKV
jgi:hypothetical protein